MDSQDPVVVVMASDDNYAQHMGIAALSVADRCSAPERLVFHFLDAGISARNVERLKTLVSTAGAQCAFITPNLDRYRDFPMLRYGVGAYLRLSMGSLLPESVERALYLDCDVLAFDDVTRLWHTDLQGRTLAAVGNLGHQGTSESLYFNSGVLLIDLKQWRSSGVEKKLMAYLDNILVTGDGELIWIDTRLSRLPLRRTRKNQVLVESVTRKILGEQYKNYVRTQLTRLLAYHQQGIHRA